MISVAGLSIKKLKRLSSREPRLPNDSLFFIMPKRLTTEEFTQKAFKKHGNKYDYSLVKYVNSKTKVKIICPKHGVFEQKPNIHFKGINECFFKINLLLLILLTKFDLYSKKTQLK